MLVVTIPTSPRLSKTEFSGKSYRVFDFGLFLIRYLNRKVKKKKKKRPAGLAGPWPGRGRLSRAVSRPTRAGRPARAGVRPAGSGGLPAQLRAGRPKAGCQAGSSVRCFSVRSLRSRPGRGAGRPPAGLTAVHFSPVFFSNGHILWPPIKRASSPFFPQAFSCSLSSIAKHFESSIPPNPSDDSCPNLGKQERRSKSTIPPNQISSK